MMKRLFVIVAAGGILLAGVGAWLWMHFQTTPQHQARGPWVPVQNERALFATYAGSQSCKECHGGEYTLWKESHHALAERRVDAVLDRPAFEPPRTLKHGTQRSEMRVDPDFQFVVVTMSTNGDRMSFPVERVIGVDPLRQYLVRAPGNRLQVTEIASDPAKGDWFDVYGEENRVSGEWGHWTGRGMTWNFMCASCHNTRLLKNYQPASDSYNTTMAEMGVGCEACHGPMANHVEWQYKYGKQKKVDPTIEKFTRDQHRDTCGTCHARRSELTGDFRPGDLFFDHYGLTIPDETDIFYPDGQVRDEDYEFMPFLASRMHAGGVRCFDCHEPHSMKTRGKGNVLCMTCHGPGTPMTNSPIIDPLAHGHHPLDKVGSGCVDCHMPLTPYMQRHLRHDHGFTVPDPLLTKQYGIPNACNRCHKDKDVGWSIEWVEKWYGARMQRPSRARAQTVAEARNGKQSAVPGLIKMMKEEERYPLWRAVAAGLLKRWSYEPEVTKALLERTKDTDALVRTMAARALELVAPGNPPVAEALKQMTSDVIRSVRTEAAWGLRATIDTNSNAGKDLVRYIAQHRDQPSGALQQGVFLLDRGQVDEAMVHLKQAVSWDTNSAPLHHALAVALSMQGKADEAIRALQTACQLAPREAEYRFKLGLAYNEVNRQKEARQALEQAVKLDADYAQGWYNLGLARASANELQEAVEALTRAEKLEPRSARIPYARATILARMGMVNEARAAAERALELEPSYAEAEGLLRMLLNQ